MKSKTDDEQLVFAIAFYNTFTKDPELFQDIIDVIERHGHKSVVVVSGSFTYPEIHYEIQDVIGRKVDVVLPVEGWKKDALRRMGIEPDIWIDSAPEGIAKQVITEEEFDG